ncbi:hypothetical protein GCM10018793_47280 [Streptomyces sulfonofaciens]|uniref:Uncharacterized protein n=1 Tax=Streptomyces sulfonofaciens TaxID=68272 RepID=A0A919L4S0_9ACTN|nr:hypothetical protein [Streptomyces sulfonofaciens]GHH84013.1 hypothetical protein GCM10018793_47280 [Streptomyces sulfonofaciens]
MRSLTRRLALGFTALAAIATLGMNMAGTASAATGQSTTLSAADSALLRSSEPKTVTMDPATGAVLSVVEGYAHNTPMISNHNICNANDGCFYSGAVPYAHQGFYGTAGTFSGNWPYRSGYYTGQYTASACWVGACSQVRLAPRTEATFSGALVTGTSFTIY